MTLNETLLFDSKVSITDFVLLQALHEKERVLFKRLLAHSAKVGNTTPTEILKKLERTGYIKILSEDFDGIVERTPLIDLFKQVENRFEALALRLQSIYPENKKGDLKGIIANLKSFYKAYKNYANDALVIDAVKLYVKEQKGNETMYMHLLHYLIKKGNIFNISPYCQKVIKQRENPESTIRLERRL